MSFGELFQAHVSSLVKSPSMFLPERAKSTDYPSKLKELLFQNLMKKEGVVICSTTLCPELHSRAFCISSQENRKD